MLRTALKLLLVLGLFFSGWLVGRLTCQRYFVLDVQLLAEPQEFRVTLPFRDFISNRNPK